MSRNTKRSSSSGSSGSSTVSSNQGEHWGFKPQGVAKPIAACRARGQGGKGGHRSLPLART